MLQFVADVHRLTYFVSKGNKMLQSVAFEEYLINIQKIQTEGFVATGGYEGDSFFSLTL